MTLMVRTPMVRTLTARTPTLRRVLLVGALAGGLTAAGGGIATASTASPTPQPAATAAPEPTPSQPVDPEALRRECAARAGLDGDGPVPADPGGIDCLLPFGGVDTGLGGTAADDDFGAALPLAALGGVGALVGAGWYVRRQRVDG